MAHDGGDVPSVAINLIKKNHVSTFGAAIYRKVPKTLNEQFDNSNSFEIEAFEFTDNDQFSNLNSFLHQLGSCVLYMSETIVGHNQQPVNSDNRKIMNVLSASMAEVIPLKKMFFVLKPDTMPCLTKLVGKTTHALSTVESERSLSVPCIECLFHCLRLRDDVSIQGQFHLKFGALNTYMRIDSAASDAINLLPKSDDPSPFGSLFGVLNRCKTKFGSRLLERWLRQPLLDVEEINKRLDIVEVLKTSAVFRNQLRDGALRSIPDIEPVIAKMNTFAMSNKKTTTAGLGEVFRLYLFAKAIPSINSVLTDLAATLESSNAAEDKDIDSQARTQRQIDTLRNTFIAPFTSIGDKLSMLEKFVEYVLDMSQLPDLVVNPKHNPELLELAQEQKELHQKANKIWLDARDGWASFCDVKLEENPQHGFILRTTKGDDERDLRAKNSSVRILSILKNGVHFTTKSLESAASRMMDIQAEYKEKQQALVDKAVQTAATYLPLIEAVAALVAQVDVLSSFATAAALAPGDYCRPNILPMGSGVIDLKEARHPCVELMDEVRYIPNDYNLIRDESGFQIITGPNMGGKSTYIRGVGSITLMAQIGMLVPCVSARISVVDSILARVGAGDAVQKGVSTFMAEMLESAVILQTATRNSLIIVDELGRGTSTFDGFGLAWAISHFIVKDINCLCLFATHFHELTVLGDAADGGNSTALAGVVNKHVSAVVRDNEVVMLYQLQPGPCSQSFGIHVAKTAGFPGHVIKEAKRKAHCLELVGGNGAAELPQDEQQHNKEEASSETAAATKRQKAQKDAEKAAGQYLEQREGLKAFRDLPIESMSAIEIAQKMTALFPTSLIQL